MQFWESVSHAEGFCTVSTNCVVLGGKTGLVIMELHSSRVQDLILSSDIA